MKKKSKKLFQQLTTIIFLTFPNYSKENTDCPNSTFKTKTGECKPCEVLIPHCEDCLQNMTCLSCVSNYKLHEEKDSDGGVIQYCDRSYWVRQWWGVMIIGFGSIIIGIIISCIICFFIRICYKSDEKKNKVKSKKKFGIFRRKKNDRKFSLEAPKVTHEYTMENFESEANLKEENEKKEFEQFKEEIKRAREASDVYDFRNFTSPIEKRIKVNSLKNVTEEQNLSMRRDSNTDSIYLPPLFPVKNTKNNMKSRFSVINPQISLNGLFNSRNLENNSPQISIEGPIVETEEENLKTKFQSRLSHFHPGTIEGIINAPEDNEGEFMTIKDEITVNGDEEAQGNKGLQVKREEKRIVSHMAISNKKDFKRKLTRNMSAIDKRNTDFMESFSSEEGDEEEEEEKGIENLDYYDSSFD